MAVFLSVTLISSSLPAANRTDTSIWSERRRHSRASGNPGGKGSGFPFHTSSNLQSPNSLAFPELVQKGRPDPFPPAVSSVVRSLLGPHAQIRHVSPPSSGLPDRQAGSASAAKIVVNIQDIHANPEAQENIGRLLQKFVQSNPVDLVALEGATSALNLERLRSFPRPNAVRAVANYLLKVNKISGPVHRAVTEPGEWPPFIGVDDKTHYEANVNAYLRAASLQERAAGELGAMERSLEREKAVRFPPALRAFDAAVAAYRKGTLSLGDYMAVLARRTAPLPAEIKTFLQALALERKLDLARVETERTRLLSELSRRLSPRATEELLQAAAAYRTGGVSHTDFYSSLRQLGRACGVSLEAYPALNDYIAYILLSNGLKIEALFAAVRRMETAAYDRLASSPEEKSIVAQSRALYLAQKLVRFELTAEEWGEYSSFRRRPESSPLPSGKDLDPGFRTGTASTSRHNVYCGTGRRGDDMSPCEAFYEEAEFRDQAIADNLLQALSTTYEVRGTPLAVLVTGGFHSQGITKRLNEAGYWTITVSPRITKLDSAAGSFYLTVFAQEKLPLENIFKGDRLLTAPPPFPEALPLLVPPVDHHLNEADMERSAGQISPELAERVTYRVTSEGPQEITCAITPTDPDGKPIPSQSSGVAVEFDANKEIKGLSGFRIKSDLGAANGLSPIEGNYLLVNERLSEEWWEEERAQNFDRIFRELMEGPFSDFYRLKEEIQFQVLDRRAGEPIAENSGLPIHITFDRTLLDHPDFFKLVLAKELEQGFYRFLLSAVEGRQPEPWELAASELKTDLDHFREWFNLVRDANKPKGKDKNSRISFQKDRVEKLVRIIGPLIRRFDRDGFLTFLVRWLDEKPMAMVKAALPGVAELSEDDRRALGRIEPIKNRNRLKHILKRLKLDFPKELVDFYRERHIYKDLEPWFRQPTKLLEDVENYNDRFAQMLGRYRQKLQNLAEKKSRTPLENAFFVVFAGGLGLRLWPVVPKFILALADAAWTLIQQTVHFLTLRYEIPLYPFFARPDQVMVLTTDAYEPVVKDLLSESKARVLVMPESRSTWGNMIWALAHLNDDDDDSVVVTVNSDHAIYGTPERKVGEPEAVIQWRETFERASRVAAAGSKAKPRIVALAYEPHNDKPETWPKFGLHRVGPVPVSVDEEAYRVEEFMESADRKIAEDMVNRGPVYLNGGSYLARADAWTELLRLLYPDQHALLLKMREAIRNKNMKQARQLFLKLPRTIDDPVRQRPMEMSVAYAALEPLIRQGSPAAGKIELQVVLSKFSFDDVGSWLSYKKIHGTDINGNAANHNATISGGVTNSILYGQSAFTRGDLNRKIVVNAKVDDLLVAHALNGDVLVTRASLSSDSSHKDFIESAVRAKDQGVESFVSDSSSVVYPDPAVNGFIAVRGVDGLRIWQEGETLLIDSREEEQAPSSAASHETSSVQAPPALEKPADWGLDQVANGPGGKSIGNPASWFGKDVSEVLTRILFAGFEGQEFTHILTSLREALGFQRLQAISALHPLALFNEGAGDAQVSQTISLLKPLSKIWDEADHRLHQAAEEWDNRYAHIDGALKLVVPFALPLLLAEAGLAVQPAVPNPLKKATATVNQFLRRTGLLKGYRVEIEMRGYDRESYRQRDMTTADFAFARLEGNAIRIRLTDGALAEIVADVKEKYSAAKDFFPTAAFLSSEPALVHLGLVDFVAYEIARAFGRPEHDAEIQELLKEGGLGRNGVITRESLLGTPAEILGEAFFRMRKHSDKFIPEARRLIGAGAMHALFGVRPLAGGSGEEPQDPPTPQGSEYAWVAGETAMVEKAELGVETELLVVDPDSKAQALTLALNAYDRNPEAHPVIVVRMTEGQFEEMRIRLANGTAEEERLAGRIRNLYDAGRSPFRFISDVSLASGANTDITSVLAEILKGLAAQGLHFQSVAVFSEAELSVTDPALLAALTGQAGFLVKLILIGPVEKANGGVGVEGTQEIHIYGIKFA